MISYLLNRANFSQLSFVGLLLGDHFWTMNIIYSDAFKLTLLKGDRYLVGLGIIDKKSLFHECSWIQIITYGFEYVQLQQEWKQTDAHPWSHK